MEQFDMFLNQIASFFHPQNSAENKQKSYLLITPLITGVAAKLALWQKASMDVAMPALAVIDSLQSCAATVILNRENDETMMYVMQVADKNSIILKIICHKKYEVVWRDDTLMRLPLMRESIIDFFVYAEGVCRNAASQSEYLKYLEDLKMRDSLTPNEIAHLAHPGFTKDAMEKRASLKEKLLDEVKTGALKTINYGKVVHMKGKKHD